MRRVIFAALAAVTLAGGAQAQGYPSRPITIVVPFSAGGPTDAIARAISERMRRWPRPSPRARARDRSAG